LAGLAAVWDSGGGSLLWTFVETRFYWRRQTAAANRLFPQLNSKTATSQRPPSPCIAEKLSPTLLKGVSLLDTDFGPSASSCSGCTGAVWNCRAVL